MSVDKLLGDLASVLEELKASSGEKKGDDGQMVALYGMFIVLCGCIRLTSRNGSDQCRSIRSWQSSRNLPRYPV